MYASFELTSITTDWFLPTSLDKELEEILTDAELPGL